MTFLDKHLEHKKKNFKTKKLEDNTEWLDKIIKQLTKKNIMTDLFYRVSS